MSDAERAYFGNGTCPPVEVPTFSPICASPAIDGSRPLALDVPVPVFYPVIPPSECACLKFNSSPHDVIVKIHDDHRNPTGKAKVAINPVGDCCDGINEVVPWVTIDLPCPLEDADILNETYDLGHGAKITQKLWVEDCGYRFESKSSAIDCPLLENGTVFSETYDLGHGAKITQKLEVRDCEFVWSTSSTPMQIAIPNYWNPCLNSTRMTVNATYKDKDGVTTKTLAVNPVSITGNMAGNCLQYSFGALTLDLSPIQTIIGSGGSAFQGDDNNLYVDGGSGADEKTWNGGGIGDIDRNDQEAYVKQRGPKMTGRPADYPFVAGQLVKSINRGFRITANNGNDVAGAWISWKANNDKSGVVKGDTAAGDVSGNLSMVLPSGFQWDKLGIAINLSHFLWNPSGILKRMNEPGDAVLVSPPPAMHKSGTYTGRNASGLAMYVKASDRLTTTVEDGLMVNCGNGIRVFGADGRTASEEMTNENDYRVGLTEVYGHDGDFNFSWDHKMVINDELTDKYSVIPEDVDPVGDAIGNNGGAEFARDHDYTILVGLPLPTAGWDGARDWLWQCSLREDEGSYVGAPADSPMGQLKQAHGDLVDLLRGLETTKTNLENAIRNMNNAYAALGTAAASLQNTADSVHGSTNVQTLSNAVESLASGVSTVATALQNTMNPMINTLTTFKDPVVANVAPLANGIGATQNILEGILQWCSTWTAAYMHISKAGTIMAINGDYNRPTSQNRHYRAPAPAQANA